MGFLFFDGGGVRCKKVCCLDLFRSMLAKLAVIKKNSCSTQMSTKFILLINVKMPLIVGILTFISMIDTPT